MGGAIGRPACFKREDACGRVTRCLDHPADLERSSRKPFSGPSVFSSPPGAFREGLQDDPHCKLRRQDHFRLFFRRRAAREISVDV